MPPLRPRAEVALDVKRGGAAGACRRDRLTVDVVNQVARGEDAFDIGPGARMRNLDIPLVITDHLVTHQFGARLVPDGDEDAGDIERPVLVGGPQQQAFDLVSAHDVEYLCVQTNSF